MRSNVTSYIMSMQLLPREIPTRLLWPDQVEVHKEGRSQRLPVRKRKDPLWARLLEDDQGLGDSPEQGRKEKATREGSAKA